MALPALEVALDLFESLFGYSLDPDVQLDDIEADSVDMMEWMLELEDQFELEVDEDALLDAVERRATIREVYSTLRAVVRR